MRDASLDGMAPYGRTRDPRHPRVEGARGPAGKALIFRDGYILYSSTLTIHIYRSSWVDEKVRIQQKGQKDESRAGLRLAKGSFAG